MTFFIVTAVKPSNPTIRKDGLFVGTLCMIMYRMFRKESYKDIPNATV
jgi:hypothetical protein